MVDFLVRLSKHNNREWFIDHKNEVDVVKAEFKYLVQSIILKIADFDDDISFLEVEKCVFRLNRDLRFTKDKTPYKNHLGAAISPTGKKGHVFYYLQIDANQDRTILAGGVWMPNKEVLNNIRKYISNHFVELEDIIYDENFANVFGDLANEKLIKVPKGFEENHPAANFLRYKSFVVEKPISKKILLSDNLEDYIVDYCKAMLPFILFLRKAVK